MFILANVVKYMLTTNNVVEYKYKNKNGLPAPSVQAPSVAQSVAPSVQAPSVAPSVAQSVAQSVAPSVAPSVAAPAPDNVFFTPSNKDKLFWSFYIILNGYEEYELYRTNCYAIEQDFKIKTIEKLGEIKSKLKELKLKRTELENELANKTQITLKGLYALCLVHNVSITYVSGQTYSIIGSPDKANGATMKHGIIVKNDKNEDSLRISSDNELFLKQVEDTYWHIENIQKPLKSPASYTLKEIQDICERLKIELTVTTDNNKIKPKTKQILYEEVLQYI